MTWIKAAAIRAAKTMAQTAIATIGTTALITEVNWLVVLSATAMAGVLSVLTSVVTTLPEVDDGKTDGKHYKEDKEDE
jgi:hypothetical protein